LEHLLRHDEALALVGGGAGRAELEPGDRLLHHSTVAIALSFAVPCGVKVVHHEARSVGEVEACDPGEAPPGAVLACAAVRRDVDGGDGAHDERREEREWNSAGRAAVRAAARRSGGAAERRRGNAARQGAARRPKRHGTNGIGEQRKSALCDRSARSSTVDAAPTEGL